MTFGPFSDRIHYVVGNDIRHKDVRVAQLDRASDYGSEGREFESSRARYQRDMAQTDVISPAPYLFLYDRKFHFLSYKKRRSAEDAHSREK